MSSKDRFSDKDRHKTPRNEKSGYQKRKLAALREEQSKVSLEKNSKIDAFFGPQNKKSTLPTEIPGTSGSSVVDHNQHGDPLEEISKDAELQLHLRRENVGEGQEQDDYEKGSGGPSLSSSSPRNQSALLAKEASIENRTEKLSEPKEEIEGNRHDMDISIMDVGLWPDKPSPKMITFWATATKQQKEKLQNCDSKIFEERSVEQEQRDKHQVYVRKCKTSFFERKTRNMENISRWWLCFSPSKGRIFCFICKLFAVGASSLCNDGFSDWIHAQSRLEEHEKSVVHVRSVSSYVKRSIAEGRVDTGLLEQEAQLTEYWSKVISRVIRVIQFLAERGLAFRGDNEIFGSKHNGNFMGILELVANYDDFLSNHIRQHGNKGSGHVNYLSSTTCEELISVMGSRVLDQICESIRESKYYSVSVDSTPDEGHLDQLAIVFRYIEDGAPVERFVTFLANRGHKGAEIAAALITFLEDRKIPISDCRGQTYDNASNMSGKYKGMQAAIKEKVPSADYIPCCGHSLNLVGKEAASSCPFASRFFDFLQNLYTFFTASTSRYEILTTELQKNKIKCVPKSLSETRWSCRADATHVTKSAYQEIKKACLIIAHDPEQKADVRNEAQHLYDKMCTLEISFYLIFWNDILERFDSTSKSLQDSKITLRCAVDLLKGLRTFVLSKRDSFENYEAEAKNLCNTETYAESQSRKKSRNVRLNPLDYEKGKDANLSIRDKFRIESFLPVIDRLVEALAARTEAYSAIYSRFGILSELTNLSENELVSAAENLATVYPDDLDSYFSGEIIQFAEIVKNYLDSYDGKVSKELFFYEFIVKNNLKSTFPNVETAFRIFLVLMSTNCTAERSFSRLKIIKNRLRTSTREERLCSLTLLSIESDVMGKIDFSDIIKAFASKKARRKHF